MGRVLPLLGNSPFALPLIFVFFLFLCIPILFFSGFGQDDFFHLALLKGSGPLIPPHDASIFGLYSFISGEPEQLRHVVASGVMPWWTAEQYHVRFWRPVAELMMGLDYRLWGASSIPMQLHSIGWFVGSLLLLVGLYRRTASSHTVAMLALLLYAIDSTHVPTISWIANRGSIIACVFALASLHFHMCWREQGRRILLLPALIFLALALLSAEYAVSVGAYLFAYAVFRDPQGPKRGFVAILPYAAVALVWIVVYKSLDFGSGGGFNYQYIDPLAYPAEFVEHLLSRVLALLFSQYGIVPADFYLAALAAGGKVPWIYLGVVLVCVAIFLTLLWPLLKSSKTLCFWLVGSTLSIVPICCGLPMDRLLLFPGIGASIVVAEFMAFIFSAAKSTVTQAWRRHLLGITGVLLVAQHLVLSPLLFWVVPPANNMLSRGMIEKVLAAPIATVVSEKTVVLLNPPFDVAAFFNSIRFINNRELPQRTWILSYFSQQDLKITRESANSIVVQRSHGFVYKAEATVRDLHQHPFSVGQQIKFDGMQATIMEINAAGHPVKVRFEFPGNLDSAQYVFLASRAGAFNTWQIPAVGNTAVLAKN